MKILVIVLSAIGLLSLNSCKQESDPQTLMENPETRTEIFNTITGNHDFMTEFMDNMQRSNHAMQMMQGNKMMMGNMMKGNDMQMMNDSTMMKNMMGNKHMMHSMMSEMMNDENMMGNMMQMMNQNGMMSNDCMKSSMKMMGDKGMNMADMNKPLLWTGSP
ncbi:hypothetical protein [Changchengzhania lutea]|uniref:hypothetical protein n=1 Tax=Changchengzhania lutea TaxID=2049305 RepID=UPI00115DB01D|nr:hypothetical protein [Changchengzhania lutea]